MIRIIVPVALCAALALAVVGHAAADEEPIAQPWATVNVCDPAANQVGARVGVSGQRRRRSCIYARFTLQWYSESQGAWLPVDGVAASPWLEVGSAAARPPSRAATPSSSTSPADGRTKQLRAVADVQWRDGGKVVRSSQAVSQAGMASDIGGSQAACALS